MAKLDMRDEAELKRIRKLFEEGLNEAAKDPDRVDQLRRDRESLIEPWEDAVKIWKKNVEDFNKKDKDDKNKDDKNKKASSKDLAALRAFEAAVKDRRGR